MNRTMRVMEWNGTGSVLNYVDRAEPRAGPGQVVLRVAACGVCRTDLHLVDGELRGGRVPDPYGRHGVFVLAIRRGTDGSGGEISPVPPELRLEGEDGVVLLGPAAALDRLAPEA